MSKNQNDCEHIRDYSEKYDAYFCSKCNSWLEKKCSDPNCYYCPNRPERPLDIR
jgi:hypothetical protein